MSTIWVPQKDSLFSEGLHLRDNRCKQQPTKYKVMLECLVRLKLNLNSNCSNGKSLAIYHFQVWSSTIKIYKQNKSPEKDPIYSTIKVVYFHLKSIEKCPLVESSESFSGGLQA